MNKFLTNLESFSNFLIALFLVTVCVFAIFVPIRYLVFQKNYYYILDDQAIERKCVREVVTVYRETYRDENGNVVLTVDRVAE